MHIYKDIIMLLSYPTLRAVLQVGLQAAFFFSAQVLGDMDKHAEAPKAGLHRFQGCPKRSRQQWGFNKPLLLTHRP